MKVPENILEVAQLKPDMLGFIFYKKSPRAVPPELAGWLHEQRETLQDVQRVGVFVNAEVDVVLNAVHDFRLNWVQLHGDESPDYCALLRNVFEATSMQKAEIIKAFQLDKAFDFGMTQPYAGHARLFLFDTKGVHYGGNGEKFDWKILESYHGNTPFLLSGGIGPEDEAALSRFQHPKWYGIDLNSQFESEAGIKDVARLKTFIEKLRMNHSL